MLREAVENTCTEVGAQDGADLAHAVSGVTDPDASRCPRRTHPLFSRCPEEASRETVTPVSQRRRCSAWREFERGLLVLAQSRFGLARGGAEPLVSVGRHRRVSPGIRKGRLGVALRFDERRGLIGHCPRVTATESSLGHPRDRDRQVPDDRRRLRKISLDLTTAGPANCADLGDDVVVDRIGDLVTSPLRVVEPGQVLGLGREPKILHCAQLACMQGGLLGLEERQRLDGGAPAGASGIGAGEQAHASSAAGVTVRSATGCAARFATWAATPSCRADRVAVRVGFLGKRFGVRRHDANVAQV
ncbi:MAG: hypothetical protein ACTH31_13955 [Pseudoclavibacter sp.]